MILEPCLGHESPWYQLQTAFERGRLGQGYLLVGPDGIGKRLFATHVAQTLLCQRRTGTHFRACGECAA
ncbi:MAG: hypothetical protein ACRCZF_19675, partial [Gemmataceae bacterium]